jgi:hypothetical protein
VGEECSDSQKERSMRCFSEAVRYVECTPDEEHGYKTVCKNSGIMWGIALGVCYVWYVCGGMCGMM